MKNFILKAVNLQFFAEGASAGGDGAGTAPIADNSGSSTRTSGKKGDLSNVVYGKQTTEGSDAENQTDGATTSQKPEDRRQMFREMIKGEWKAEFDEFFQSTFDRRHKGYKEVEAQYETAKPILDMLMQKHNISDGDLKKLAEAIDSDDAYFEEAAEAEGLTVEQYKAVQKLRRENDEFKRAAEQMRGRQYAEAQMAEWGRQIEETKAIYPDFDFDAERQNPEFVRLLKAHVPVKTAYEVLNNDKLITGAAKVAAQQAQQRTVANIQKRNARPAENGTSSQSASIIKSDVSSLTKKDREEIARRVAAGERIVF